MKLPGWKPVGGSSGRYINPSGNEVSRREYLNAQAKSVGWHNYSQYQREINKPLYSKAIASAKDSAAARRLDSDFNRQWAREIAPRMNKGERIGSTVWEAVFDDLELDDDSDLYESYVEGEQ